MKNDSVVQEDVLNELKWNPFLHAANIGVSVKNGVVTLSGEVDSYLEKVEAEKAVHKVAGVRAVALDIQVGISPGNFRTDAEIAEAVLNSLKWHTSIPEEKIVIKVENGIVTLDGEVDWAYQRASVKDLVSNLAGVKSVINLITVKPRVAQTDIKEKIQDAFRRVATVDAQHISVEVIGNKVLLKGKVRSYAERNDAENAAWSAPGIIEVDNRLEVVDQEEYSF
ncbi:BON domain-containing protein [Segetibacter koreensis]|uniref:BON domain-containing protein n=1 Tax=Segetibacter koreensis TaxID=398037 RepID=UPI00036049A9|nr:BON domain-containing protein [Segetibacter koreensis]